MTSSTLSPSRPITTKDVALAAGVNRASVSVVLNGARSNSGVSEAMRRKIMETAEQLGYRRNGSAANMARGRFGCVALLLSTKPNVSALPQMVWENIHDELALHGIHLSLFRLPDAAMTDEALIPKCLTEWMADGLIVDYAYEVPQKLNRLIEDNRLPAIWFNTLRDYDCVRPDDYNAGQLAARHLLELGHRRIAYMDFSHYERDFPDFGARSGQHYSTFHRYRALCEQMKPFGATPLLCARRGDDDDFNIHQRRLGHITQLLREQRPSAVITYGGANLPLLAARDLGLKVPDQLSVVDFDQAQSRPAERLTTSVAPPESLCGRELVQQLLRKIADPSAQLPCVTLPFRLHQGETSGPPATL